VKLHVLVAMIEHLGPELAEISLNCALTIFD
jgi:hypothetical protein